MGEIGISPHTFLYDLRLWEIMSIIRGYRQRQKPVWEATRRAAFFIISAMPYVDIRKAGIFRDSDLYKLPWDESLADTPPPDAPTPAEVEEMKQMLIREQREAAARRAKNN